MSYTEQDFKDHFKELSLLEENQALLGWDELTGMPEDSESFRSELSGYIADKYFSLWISDKTKEMLDYFNEHQDELSEVSQANLKIATRQYAIDNALSAEEFSKLQKLTTVAQSKWQQARKENDWTIYKTALKDVIDLQKTLIPKWRTNDQDSNYDVLLKMYEPDFNTEKLNEVFGKVREGLLDIRKNLDERGIQIDNEFLNRDVEVYKQREYVLGSSARLGYDYNKGRLDDTIHPFMTSMNRNDARITTRWNKNNFQMAILGIAHEAGHGLFQQNVDPKFDYTMAEKNISMSIHESQSLFNEVFIGRNKGYLRSEFEAMKLAAQGQFDDVDFETFYKGWNKTEATLVRTEADPLTYPLHIMIRFEIEQAIFNDDLDVESLPEFWNKKYKDYLDIDVPDDLGGVLQDVHWAGGSFGYFPSYALGHFFAAQFLNTMKKDIDVDKELANGNIQPLFEWRKERVWQYGGSKTPLEILRQATGEDLDVNYWIDYMRDFYYDIYEVK
ncbi:MAG: carboxypeptidase M32 [Lactobacillaceae bacterium]|jgi:carboxypeptidase Taq|nr:carboxypeptidase M32 [Lactobacillaceae bacterium]